MIRVAIDAMGGDYAPGEIAKGAVSAVQRSENVKVVLVGNPEAIDPCLEGLEYDTERLEVAIATEVIETGDHPVEAIRTKKDSSMNVGLTLLKEGEVDAFVSAGNSGALMVGSQLLVGRKEGVKRAPFAHLVPTKLGNSLLLDCGANVDVRPEHLVTFAKLGSEYMTSMYGISSPKVGIVNIGTEETKGNELTLEASKLLKEEAGINFIGNVEPTGITEGAADVLVCDGFTGNIIIKLYEGLGKLLLGTLKDTFKSNAATMLGAALVKGKLKKAMKRFDSHEYGGAPILGLNGLVLKTHGNAKAKEIENSILQCVEYFNR